MALDSGEVRVASDGRIWTGAVDAAPPTDVTTAISAVTYTDLGYASEDGVTLSPSMDTEDINAWQTASPVRRVVTGSALEIGFTLIQTNQTNLQLFLNGTSGANKVDVPRAPAILEKSLIVEWIDGAKTYRLYIARATLSEAGETTLARGEAVGFEMTWTALPSSVTATPLATVLLPAA